MALRVARMENGLVAEIFTEGQGSVTLYDRTLKFKHLKTWVQQGDQMAALYNLVAIVTPERPAFDAQTQLVRSIPVKIGDAAPVDGWEVIAKPSNEVRAAIIIELKDRAWNLWGLASWDKGRTEWFNYRDELKTRGVSLLASFDQGKKIDAYIGSVDGVGAWPV